MVQGHLVIDLLIHIYGRSTFCFISILSLLEVEIIENFHIMIYEIQMYQEENSLTRFYQYMCAQLIRDHLKIIAHTGKEN